MRAFAVIILVVLSFLEIEGQEVYYYGINSKPVNTEKKAILVKEVEQKSERSYVIRTRFRAGDRWINVERQRIKVDNDGFMRIRIKGERLFPKTIFRETKRSEQGLIAFEETNRFEVTLRTGFSSRYLPLHLEGTVAEFYPNGERKSVSEFSDNQLISNRNWRDDGTAYVDSIFYSADKEPLFTPGEAFFSSYLIQQLERSKIDMNQIEDEVVIGWVVMETGVIDGVIALKGKSLLFNKFLVETIAGMPGKWKPAELNGEPVRYFMSIPLNFMHNDVLFQDVEFASGMLLYNTY